MKFITPDLTDNRIVYASKALEEKGLVKTENPDNADFVLLGVNPDKHFLQYSIPVFAGNISSEQAAINIYDYTKNEGFALRNAYLTAEGALSLAISESEKSLINASVLITGYGRIGKALHRYLSPFTSNITVCARGIPARAEAESKGANTVSFDKLEDNSVYDFIFNTVPHPVFNAKELSSVRGDAMMIDLASFPGGIDKHIARVNSIKLLTARGLPSKYSPQNAGETVAQAVEEMIKEVFV